MGDITENAVAAPTDAFTETMPAAGGSVLSDVFGMACNAISFEPEPAADLDLGRVEMTSMDLQAGQYVLPEVHQYSATSSNAELGVLTPPVNSDMQVHYTNQANLDYSGPG